MSTNPTRALQILSGSNHFRFLVITVLLLLIILGLLTIQYMGFGMILLIGGAIAGILAVRFPYMLLFDDKLVVEKRAIISKLSDKEVYRFDEIKEVEFEDGYVNWGQMIFQSILGTAAYGGFSKSDQLIIRFQNDSMKIIYRFGKREPFKDISMRTINKIKMHPAPNAM